MKKIRLVGVSTENCLKQLNILKEEFEKRGANIGSAILVSLVALLICMFACYIVPDAIKLVDNFITVVGRG